MCSPIGCRKFCSIKETGQAELGDANLIDRRCLAYGQFLSFAFSERCARRCQQHLGHIDVRDDLRGSGAKRKIAKWVYGLGSATPYDTRHEN
jgi:hypothetical protein